MYALFSILSYEQRLLYEIRFFFVLSSYIELNYTRFGSHVVEITHPANIHFCTKHQSYYVHTSVSDTRYRSTTMGQGPSRRAEVRFTSTEFGHYLLKPVFIPVLKRARRTYIVSSHTLKSCYLKTALILIIYHLRLFTLSLPIMFTD
jgi:hypothetical protein